MTFVYYGCTRTGAVRANNEDAILMRVDEDAALFLVADGIGGGESGEVVSAMLRDGCDRWWNGEFLPISRNAGFHQNLERIRNLLQQINSEAVQRFGEWKSGSTLVLLFIDGANYACISSGDSRIYRMRGFSWNQITRDDTYGNQMKGRNAEISPSTARRLVSAVGISSRLEYSLRTDQIRAGSRFFLCSDGVYGYMPAGLLRKRLTVDSLLLSPQKAAERICGDVVSGGAGDNYSMILVKSRPYRKLRTNRINSIHKER